MKLTGFYRGLELNNDAAGKQKRIIWGNVPVLLHEYGIKTCYVFVGGSKTTKECLLERVVDIEYDAVPLVSRNMRYVLYITKVRESGKYEFCG